MSRQLDAVWQRRSASSNRLAQVSAEFLSDTSETRQDKESCRAIFFLLDNPELDWITQDLCQLLTRRGHKSTHCPLEESSQNQQQAVFPEQLEKHAGSYEYCLFPVTSTSIISAHQPDHVVLLVPADLEAVLAAYRRIKLLRRLSDTPEMGVVMVGPRDQHAAWRYFRKLAVGALRYLDVPLLNLGFLPEHITPAHGQANHHRNNFLARISERLLRSEFYSSYSPQEITREKD